MMRVQSVRMAQRCWAKVPARSFGNSGASARGRSPRSVDERVQQRHGGFEAAMIALLALS